MEGRSVLAWNVEGRGEMLVPPYYPMAPLLEFLYGEVALDLARMPEKIESAVWD